MGHWSLPCAIVRPSSQTNICPIYLWLSQFVEPNDAAAATLFPSPSLPPSSVPDLLPVMECHKEHPNGARTAAVASSVVSGRMSALSGGVICRYQCKVALTPTEWYPSHSIRHDRRCLSSSSSSSNNTPAVFPHTIRGRVTLTALR